MNIKSTGNAEFDNVLLQMAEMHRSKNADYANEDEPLANFLRQADITGLSVDMVFFNAIAIKIARLTELVGSEREPKNESVDDTVLDLATYSALWMSWRQREAV